MSTNDPPKPPAAEPVDVDDLAAQLGGISMSLRKMQTSSDDVQHTQAQLTGAIEALVSTLTTAGVLPARTFERARERAVAAAEDKLVELKPVRIDKTPDKYAVTGPTDLDCAAIIPICGARCCKLRVCLSAQDIEEGILGWDLTQPYQSRRRRDTNYCVYSDTQTRRCGVYDYRPGICRAYDCRDDKRIWVDFEKRILAELPAPAP